MDMSQWQWLQYTLWGMLCQVRPCRDHKGRRAKGLRRTVKAMVGTWFGQGGVCCALPVGICFGGRIMLVWGDIGRLHGVYGVPVKSGEGARPYS